MEINFRVSGRIAKPVEEVFEAVADPAQLAGQADLGPAQLVDLGGIAVDMNDPGAGRETV